MGTGTALPVSSRGCRWWFAKQTRAIMGVDPWDGDEPRLFCRSFAFSLLFWSGYFFLFVVLRVPVSRFSSSSCGGFVLHVFPPTPGVAPSTDRGEVVARRKLSLTSFSCSSFSFSPSSVPCRREILWRRMVPLSSSSLPFHVSASDRGVFRPVPVPGPVPDDDPKTIPYGISSLTVVVYSR